MPLVLQYSYALMLEVCHQRAKKHTNCLHLLPHDPRAVFEACPGAVTLVWAVTVKVGQSLGARTHTHLSLLLPLLLTEPGSCHVLGFSPFAALKSTSITFNPRVQLKLCTGLKYTNAHHTFGCFVLLWGESFIRARTALRTSCRETNRNSLSWVQLVWVYRSVSQPGVQGL